jgi:hypothetical protein
MKSQRILLLPLLLLLLSSCGPSKYMSKTDNFWGLYGYSDMPLDSTTYQVTYAGDQTVPADLVDRYALYRCAELTTSKGFNYFVILDKDADANTTTTSTTTPGAETHNTTIEHDIDPQTGKSIPVAVTTTNQDYMTTTSSSTTHTVMKTIRMFKGERPGDNANAYDAKSMVSVMGPTISR